MLKFQLNFKVDDFKSNQADFDKFKDSIFICGSPKFLGEWNVQHAVEMELRQMDETSSLLSSSLLSNSSLSLSSTGSYGNFDSTNCLEFEADVKIADDELGQYMNQTHSYKYFIGRKCNHQQQEDKKLFLKQVGHAHKSFYMALPNMSIVDNNTHMQRITDTWPTMDVTTNKLCRIDDGWLLNGEVQLQFNFFNEPLQALSPEFTQKQLVFEIIPWVTRNGLRELENCIITHSHFNEEKLSVSNTSSFNALNHSDVYTQIKIRTYEKPENLLFQVSIHALDDGTSYQQNKLSQKCLAISYYKVNKLLINNSLVETELSLHNSNAIVGSLQTQILMITSIETPENYVIKNNYNYDFSRKGVKIGHRGMGATFEKLKSKKPVPTNLIENTINSFREAHKLGVDMVEFDIVLTKDNVPIVFHDFVFCINNPNFKGSKKYIEVSVNQLTYEEVKQNRILSSLIKDDIVCDDYSSENMFPTLNELFTSLDGQLGFNVEIKYPMELEDDSHEVTKYINWLNRNDYVETIIREMYASHKDSGRFVILSTFDPNLCTMLRLKQNKFPVFFITNGKQNKYIPYKDARGKNTSISLNYARADYLHGLSVFSQELVANWNLKQTLYNHSAKSTNFCCYSWGEDLNHQQNRQLIADSVDGLIFDKIHDPTDNYYITSDDKQQELQ